MTGTMGDTSEDPLEDLYPALVECFGVILIGYVSGRLGIVTNQQTAGLSTFVGMFSLPMLIFMSLATLDLSIVSWYFLLAVLIAKAIVFAAVLFITLLVSKPVNPGRAGLYAIFTTQSNDFALGYPIVLSLYGKSHPEFVSYLYLLVPVSMVMLNPFGFVLMELGKRKSGEGSNLKLLGSIALSVATNPVVFMTALGIAGNFIFHHQVPPVLGDLLNAFGSAFTATSLFLLGLRMVGKIQTLQGHALIVPILLIMAKELALPVVIREVTSLLLSYGSSGNSTDYNAALSNYGFLYGTFPSAPGVFVYSTSYNLDVDLIASSMVICTFVSAPLMFISAKMVAISSMTPTNFVSSLFDYDLDLSIIGLIASIWLIFLFIYQRKFSKLPQLLTLCLIISGTIGCLGVVINRILSSTVTFVLYTVASFADLSSTLWTAFLSVSLVLLSSHNHSLLQKLQLVFPTLAWGVPFIILASLMLSMKPNDLSKTEWNEHFLYGRVEAGIFIFILFTTFIVGIVSLVAHQRNKKRHRRYLSYVRETSSTTGPQSTNGDPPNVVDPEGVIGSNESLIDEETTDDESQITCHLVLIFVLLTSVFVSLSLCIWRIIMEDINGVYVELQFLSVTLRRGQNIMIFFIFFSDTITVLQPLFQRCRILWTGGEPIQLPPTEDLSFETQHICEQFITHHLDACKSQIQKTARVRLWQCKQCFTGESFVSWLISQGIVTDRAEGLSYASHLLTGRVIQHSTNTQFFSDDSSLFIFPSSD